MTRDILLTALQSKIEAIVKEYTVSYTKTQALGIIEEMKDKISAAITETIHESITERLPDNTAFAQEAFEVGKAGVLKFMADTKGVVPKSL